MNNRKNWSYYKPGDLLIRIRQGEEDADSYENPYIDQALSMGDQVLTAADLLHSRLQPLSPAVPLILEVGCYKGTTLTALAQQNPHCRFLGIDIKYKRVVLSRRKLNKAGIGQQAEVAIIDAIDCLEILPRHCLQGICIFYPDPWPKERFQERRMFSPYVSDLLLSRISGGGFLWIKTDHVQYLQQIQGTLSRYPLSTQPSPPSPLQPGLYPTDFENLFRNQKKPLFELCLQKNDSP